MSKLTEAFALHGIEASEGDNGSVVLAQAEAYEVIGYLELMHQQLFVRGVCANGSPHDQDPKEKL